MDAHFLQLFVGQPPLCVLAEFGALCGLGAAGFQVQAVTPLRERSRSIGWQGVGALMEGGVVV
jgi:hypothetical protein